MKKNKRIDSSQMGEIAGKSLTITTEMRNTVYDADQCPGVFWKCLSIRIHRACPYGRIYNTQ